MKSLNLFAALLLMFTLGTGFALAQSDRGTIRGTVTDPNDAVVANAKVTVTSVDNGETRETTTGDEGIYVFPELKSGLYRVTVEASGFSRTSVEDVKVDVQGVNSLVIKLQLGEVSGNIVTVTADAVAINSDSPVRQTTVTERQVRELPLQVSSEAGGRSPLSFIFLDSNVGASDQSGDTNASKFRVSGGQASGTEILIDGASTRRTQNGNFFSEVAPGPNAYQEFTVSTNSFSAEFGNSSGGVVSFTLKSGTNDFHGEAYDLIRNEDLNANSYFNNANRLERNRDNENNFGFNIGGPIYVPNFGEGTPGGMFRSLKDRAFFFFNYEGFRFTQGVNSLQSVPTERMRTGDFGELLTDPYVLSTTGPIRIYDPRQPIENRNLIPGNRLDQVPGLINGRPLLDPAGLAILSFYPLPTRTGVHNNYESTIAVPATSNQFQIKTDFTLTQKQHLNFSFSRRLNERFAGAPPLLPLPFVQAFGPFQQNFKTYIARLQHDYTLTSTLINHLNVGYTYYNTKNGNTTLGFDTSSLGIPQNATSNQAFPLIDFVGQGNNGNSPKFTTDIGSTDFSDHIRDGSLEISDAVTYIRGKQTFKFGATVRRNQYNVQQLIHPGGRFGFHQDQTRRNGDSQSGSPLASLVAGATEWSFQGNDQVDPAFRQMTQSYFIQDDIKISQKLTVNIGLRYDLPGARVEAHDRFRSFDPDVINPAIGRRGAIVGAAGQGGLQAQFRSLSPQDKTNIGPRLGAAYALNSKTVIRAGIGLYYAPLIYGVGGNGSLKDGTIGYNFDDYLTTPGPGAIPSQWLSTFQALPTSNNNPGTQAVGTNSTIPFFDQEFKTGRTLQYTVDLQRELPYRFVASFGYIGHTDDRLRSNFGRLNAVPLNSLRLGFPILSKRFNDLTAADRAYASSVGVNIPATANGVFTGFNGGCGDIQCTVAQALRPFPQYGRIDNYLESQGSSNYHAVQFKVDRRFSQGIQFGLAYTFSRLITNASEDILGGSPLENVIQNPFDRAPLKTVSPTNAPHVFVANFLAELPFGKGKRFLDKGGVVNAIFGGFQISGIFRYQAGVPLVVFVSSQTRGGNDAINNWTNLVGYYTNLRPNLTGQALSTIAPCVNIPPAPDRRFALNCGAFSFPTDFTRPPVTDPSSAAYSAYYADPLRFFGTAPVVNTDFRSPMYFSENLNILKKTRFTETVYFEIGAEFFNLFNRTRFLQPDGNLGRFNPDNGRFDNGNFGQEGVAQPVGPFGGNRVIQLRARLVF
ncbi:MAG: TonB-dependent receptor [Pyrinomonadaceae bacterium]